MARTAREAAGELEARAVELRERARSLAEGLHREALASTTHGCERAMLRLFGVGGLDRAGRPLAQEVVDRFAALGPARLGGGIALPFAAAAREYDLEPQELALEIADGHIDLGLEAELLREPDARAGAEAMASGWLRSAWERFDANRTARSELRGLLGDGGAGPIVGVDLPEVSADVAAAAVPALAEAGLGLVRLQVPRDRELRRGLGEELDEPDRSSDVRRAPAGSQRGLAHLRSVLDEEAARRGRYLRLGSRSIGLAAPEQAVVAGFERVDFVFTDPLEPPVEFGVDPARAFADHAFAVELHARSRAVLVLGGGPLAVAPEISRGEPIAPATRAGRALALQALALELTRCGSLPSRQIRLVALPDGLRGERASLVHGLAEVQLRRLAFPEHGLVFTETGADDGARWPLALAPWLVGGGPPDLVLRRAGPGGVLGREDVARIGAALDLADALESGRELGGLRGAALEHARSAIAVAIATLRQIAADGWGWLLDVGPAGSAQLRGAHARRLAVRPVPRRDAFDPFKAGSLLG